MTLTHLEVAVATARDELMSRFASRVSVNAALDRTLVSFQANKKEAFYQWFKYKEGFSQRLVRYFLDMLTERPGVLLDPFAGAGAALFASRDNGWRAIGVELLPVGFYAMTAREAAEKVDPEAFARQVTAAEGVDFARHWRSEFAFPHIVITRGAFPARTERELGGFLAYCEDRIHDPPVRELFQFAAFCILEEISYTRKDGQYLRWDYRSERARVKGHFDKGEIRPFRDAISSKLRRMADDLAHTPSDGNGRGNRGALDIRKGSCFEVLPDLRSGAVNLVITSPPYCNRYDYTRTYALELAFLGRDDDEVKRLRQQMLSCTVENKEKREELRRLYARKRRPDAFSRVEKVFDDQEALQEVLAFLEQQRAAGNLNNDNISRMVHHYFYEMCFVVHELARIVAPGGKVVMVNDNVQYAGEEIPVDLILSDFARTFGLKVKHIWTLPRGKGNSSQQMGSHGRRELRKCVYVWER